jgi:hypothetical protein
VSIGYWNQFLSFLGRNGTGKDGSNLIYCSSGVDAVDVHVDIVSQETGNNRERKAANHLDDTISIKIVFFIASFGNFQNCN